MALRNLKLEDIPQIRRLGHQSQVEWQMFQVLAVPAKVAASVFVPEHAMDLA